MAYEIPDGIDRFVHSVVTSIWTSEPTIINAIGWFCCYTADVGTVSDLGHEVILTPEGLFTISSIHRILSMSAILTVSGRRRCLWHAVAADGRVRDEPYWAAAYYGSGSAHQSDPNDCAIHTVFVTTVLYNADPWSLYSKSFHKAKCLPFEFDLVAM